MGVDQLPFESHKGKVVPCLSCGFTIIFGGEGDLTPKVPTHRLNRSGWIQWNLSWRPKRAVETALRVRTSQVFGEVLLKSWKGSWPEGAIPFDPFV